MKRVLTALVLIPLVLLAVFRAPDWLFTALVGVVAVLATIEYLQIAAKYGYKVYPWVTCGAVAAIYAAVAWRYFVTRTEGYTFYRPYSDSPSFRLFENIHDYDYSIATLTVLLLVVLTLLPSLLLTASMRVQTLKEALPGAAFSYFAIPYVGLSLLSLAVLRAMTGGWFLVLFTFFAVWVGDTAAYYVGRSIGKTPFAPRISPKKTWEGAIASVVGAMIVGAVWSHFGEQLLREQWLFSSRSTINKGLMLPSPMFAAVIALVINVAAQLGDLFESLIKRGADVKDSGTMLPGHGGILDRIDALLFAAPVALVMFMILGDRFR